MASKHFFISHAKEDSDVAGAICARIEAEGMTCWIAPRDIAPGTSWASAIVRGIEDADALLLVLTKHSNASDHVTQEIRLAFDNGKPIYGILLEELAINDEIEYFVGGQQYIQAIGQTPAQFMPRFLQSLQGTSSRADRPPLLQQDTPKYEQRSYKPLLIGLGAVVGLMVVLWFVAQQNRSIPADITAAEAEVVPQDQGDPRPESMVPARPGSDLSLVEEERLPPMVDRALGMTFVYIPKGSFVMGSSEGEAVEKPAHKVSLSKAFYLSEHEITQAQWAKFMDAKPSQFQGANHPVENVSWWDVQKFIEILKEETGHHYRLPSEAEWEYAARAGSETAFSFGEDLTDIKSFAVVQQRGGHQPVKGQRAPNAWQLYDMHGNVAEWTQDRVRRYTNSSATDPTGPGRGNFIVRGGSWGTSAKQARSSSRIDMDPSTTDSRIGFRLLRELN